MFSKIVAGVLVVGSVVCVDYLVSFGADPLTEVPVIVAKGENIYAGITGEDGKFSISKLPAGKYTVSFMLPSGMLSVELSSNWKSNLHVLSPASDTHIAVTRRGKKLSGKIEQEVFPEPTPEPTSTPD